MSLSTLFVPNKNILYCDQLIEANPAPPGPPNLPVTFGTTWDGPFNPIIGSLTFTKLAPNIVMCTNSQTISTPIINTYNSIDSSLILPIEYRPINQINGLLLGKTINAETCVMQYNSGNFRLLIRASVSAAFNGGPNYIAGSGDCGFSAFTLTWMTA